MSRLPRSSTHGFSGGRGTQNARKMRPIHRLARPLHLPSSTISPSSLFLTTRSLSRAQPSLWTSRPFQSAATSLTIRRMASTLPSSPIFQAIARHDPQSPAIIHSSSDRTFCYGSLLHDVAAAKDNLTALVNGKSLVGERIAFLAENGYDYVGAIHLRFLNACA